MRQNCRNSNDSQDTKAIFHWNCTRALPSFPFLFLLPFPSFMQIFSSTPFYFSSLILFLIFSYLLFFILFLFHLFPLSFFSIHFPFQNGSIHEAKECFWSVAWKELWVHFLVWLQSWGFSRIESSMWLFISGVRRGSNHQNPPTLMHTNTVFQLLLGPGWERGVHSVRASYSRANSCGFGSGFYGTAPLKSWIRIKKRI